MNSGRELRDKQLTKPLVRKSSTTGASLPFASKRTSYSILEDDEESLASLSE